MIGVCMKTVRLTTELCLPVYPLMHDNVNVLYGVSLDDFVYQY